MDKKYQYFSSVCIFDQVEQISELISRAGDESNPNQNILSIFAKYLETASPGGRIEICKHLPSWIKKQEQIFCFLPDLEKKLFELRNAISKLNDSENVNEEIIEKIADCLRDAKEHEYRELIKEVQSNIRNHTKIKSIELQREQDKKEKLKELNRKHTEKIEKTSVSKQNKFKEKNILIKKVSNQESLNAKKIKMLFC